MLRLVLFLVDYLLLSSTFCDLDLFFEIDFFGLSVTPKLMTLVASYTRISDSGHKKVYLVCLVSNGNDSDDANCKSYS